MSSGWSWYIVVLTVVNIVACLWLIRWTTRKRPGESTQGDVTGHAWDDDLQEYNNPLPRWWLGLFYLTIVFAAVYLIIYPGLGNYQGTSKVTQQSEYNDEVAAAARQYGPIFAAYAKQDIPALAKDAKAMESGQRLFLNYCATCHGSDGGGFPGFPSLKDKDWLYGGAPDVIKASILDGRSATMPAMGGAMTAEQLDQVTAYVTSLSGRASDATLVQAGKGLYTQMACFACHGTDGTGKDLPGPNLTDNIWLYGGSPGTIKETIKQGRNGKMPAHREFLGEEKAHLLAAYVYSLSQ